MFCTVLVQYTVQSPPASAAPRVPYLSMCTLGTSPDERRIIWQMRPPRFHDASYKASRLERLASVVLASVSFSEEDGHGLGETLGK